MIAEKGRKPGHVESISFRPAEGGLVSETTTKYKRGGSGGGPDSEYDRETGIHPTIEHAIAHLKETMGHHYKGGKPAKEESSHGEGAE